MDLECVRPYRIWVMVQRSKAVNNPTFKKTNLPVAGCFHSVGHAQKTGKEGVVFNAQQSGRSEISTFLTRWIPYRRFRMEADKVYDSWTDLTWQRHAFGLKWHGSGHTRTVFKQCMTFDQAVAHAWDGAWRLPEIEELKSLLTDQRPDGYHVDTTVFPDVVQDTPQWYWSATPDGPLLAWAVNFHLGHACSGGRNVPNAVRLVRSGR